MEGKTLWSYENTWTDEYGVTYSEDKKVLLSFPNYFNHPIYVVHENCIRISEGAFSLPFLINSYSGEEFLTENGQHIRIEEFRGGRLKWIGCDTYNDNWGFFCGEVESFLKDYMSRPYAELRNVIKNLFYLEVVAREDKGKYIIVRLFVKKNRNFIRRLIFPNLSIEIPKSVISIIENIDELVTLSDKGDIVNRTYRLSSFKRIISGGFNFPVFSGDPAIDIINAEEIVNWNEFKDEHGLKNNRYVEDIRTFIRVQSGNQKFFPVILFPNSLKKQASKRYSSSELEDKDKVFTYEDVLNTVRKLGLKGHSWNYVYRPVSPFHPFKEKFYRETKEEFSKCGKLKYIYRKFTKAVEKEAQKRYVKELENAYDYLRYKEYSVKKDYAEKKKEQALFLDTYADKIASCVWKHCIKGIGGLHYEENPRIGHYEKILYIALYAKFPEYLKINRKKGIYYPDFVMDIGGHYFIDVEIDEPYAFNKETMIPIHYIGADDVRNEYFKEQNWFVIRFAEQQIKESLNECIDIVSCVVKFIKTGNAEELIPIIHVHKKIAIPKWTRDDAMAMDIVNTRQNGYDLPFDEALYNLWKEICDANKSK